MDLKGFQELWEDFLAFLDRTVQWFMYIFGAADYTEWPPKDYPDINEPYVEPTTNA